MKICSSRTVGASVCVLLIVSVAASKVTLSKLLISGGKLSQPIEVTDPQLLRSSNPWFGTFIPQWNEAPRQRIADPPVAATRYEISFWAQFSPKEPQKIIYVAYYAFDPVAHRGFVYLPGPGEPSYSTNARRIIRPHQDGRWSEADAAWCEQINAIISHSASQ